MQIENEYLFGGEGKGDEHIRTLTEMAKKAGFTAPIYTATGWVSAYIGDLLPTFCGYVCAPTVFYLLTTGVIGNLQMYFSETSIGAFAIYQ